MKKYFLISAIALLFSMPVFSQEEIVTQEELVTNAKNKMDLDFRFYLPSIFGNVTGSNSFLGLRENYKDVESCINLMIESRGTIVSSKKLSFSWAFGMGSYIENNKTGENLFSINMSLGAGLYYRPFKTPDYPLNGFCFYLYPAYQIPVYKENSSSYLAWKTAFDLGYNMTLLNCITIYPYIRNIFGWNSGDFRYGFDCGISIGLYIHDLMQTL